VPLTIADNRPAKQRVREEYQDPQWYPTSEELLEEALRDRLVLGDHDYDADYLCFESPGDGSRIFLWNWVDTRCIYRNLEELLGWVVYTTVVPNDAASIYNPNPKTASLRPSRGTIDEPAVRPMPSVHANPHGKRETLTLPVGDSTDPRPPTDEN